MNVKNTSRAEELLNSLEALVGVNTTKDRIALKAIEEALINAYERGWYDGGGPLLMATSDGQFYIIYEHRRSAKAYATDPEKP